MEKRSFLMIGLGLGLAELASLAAAYSFSYLTYSLAIPEPAELPGLIPALQILAMGIVQYGVLILVVWLWVRGLPRLPKPAPVKLSEGLFKNRVSSPVGVFVLIMLVSLGISYILAFVGSYADMGFTSGIKTLLSPFFRFPDTAPPPYSPDTPLEFIATCITTVLYAPVLEELLFRRILLDRLRPFGDKTALLFTAVTFGLAHLNFGQFFFAAFLGLIMGYLMLRTNRLIFPIILHMLYNSVSALLIPLLNQTGPVGGYLGDTTWGEFAFSGFYMAMMVIGPAVFFTNLKRLKLERPVFRFSRPLGGALMGNAGTVICLVIYILLFVFMTFLSLS